MNTLFNKLCLTMKHESLTEHLKEISQSVCQSLGSVKEQRYLSHGKHKTIVDINKLLALSQIYTLADLSIQKAPQLSGSISIK